jgi:RPA family protein
MQASTQTANRPKPQRESNIQHDNQHYKINSSMSQSTQSRPQRKEAVRVFAPEFNEAGIEFKDPDELEEQGDRAPNYLLLPTGDRANRVLMVGTLTDTTEVSDKTIRGRVVDVTGETFFVYAGEQYNSEEYSDLNRLETPQYLMVIGKPNTYTTDDGDTYVSVDPENIIVTDEGARERWAAETAEQTLDRIEAFEAGEAPHGEDAATHYDYDLSELRDCVEEVVEELATNEPETPDTEVESSAEVPSPDTEESDIDPEATA